MNELPTKIAGYTLVSIDPTTYGPRVTATYEKHLPGYRNEINVATIEVSIFATLDNLPWAIYETLHRDEDDE